MEQYRLLNAIRCYLEWTGLQ